MPKIEVDMQPTKSELKEILAFANRQLTLIGDDKAETYNPKQTLKLASIAELELALKDRNAELKQVSEVDLPAAMASVGMKVFTLDNGMQVKIEADIAVNIPTDQKAWCYNWLKKNGFGDIIKDEFKVTFPTGKEKEAQEFYKELAKRQLDFSENMSIHSGTLKKFVKERIEAASDENPKVAKKMAKLIPDFKKFGVFPYNKTTIKPVKAKAAGKSKGGN